ncbi:post-GPI attachment to proteins factor 2-like [Dreissena polymorpha]|uniref:post-GPI attachment to proteins factor 2-like n=1 Tax=Dreissena polymorpha TaxID=45954 RepID=UPI002265408B|nr:post-GPI attachment to proteins factor 2-like [Dreissena polymorpha]
MEKELVSHAAMSGDTLWLKRRMYIGLFNMSIFLTALYFFFRHNSYCEPYVYSWFALCEYLTIFSNIAFHSICNVDFSRYSFTFMHNEDIVSGKFTV